MLDLDSLFKLSYGMCIVSSNDGDRLCGCIINTVFQVVPEPPMIAISVNRGNLTHQYIAKSGVFSVSILGEQTPTLFIGKFGFRSGRDFDKFQDVKYSIGLTGAPIVLDNAVAFIEAKVTHTIDVVTHTIFFAEILVCQTLDGSGHPMTYEYYRDVKHGRTPRTAATYHEKN